MDKEILNQFLGTKIKLVKDDGFIIWGFIVDVFDDAILFDTDGRTIYLCFDRIKEIMPYRRKQNRRKNFD